MSREFLPAGAIVEATETVGRWPWKPEAPPAQDKESFADRWGGRTLEEVARELGVTRERVRQIEMMALRKCRAWAAERGMRLEDLL
jgi:hypothetical protein